MPFRISKGTKAGKKVYVLKRADTGKVVGHSTTPGKIWASAQYRMGATPSNPVSLKKKD